MLLVYIAMGPAPVKSFAQLTVLGLVAIPLLLLSPAGHGIIAYLPFVGSIDESNVTYRQRLLEISIQVIMQHPFFGAYDFFYSPAMQELKQGSTGFIDLVNTYLGVGLSSGFVGLTLFIGFFIAVLAGLFKSMRGLPDRQGELYILGRALLSVVLCIMVMIFTVSSITVIPTVYWALAGVSVAYARMLAIRAAPVPTPATAGIVAPQPALTIAHLKSR
jgi:O-antigen ligase